MEFIGSEVVTHQPRQALSSDILRTIKRNAEQILDAIVIAEVGIPEHQNSKEDGPEGRVRAGRTEGVPKKGRGSKRLTAAS